MYAVTRKCTLRNPDSDNEDADGGYYVNFEKAEIPADDFDWIRGGRWFRLKFDFEGDGDYYMYGEDNEEAPIEDTWKIA